MSLNMDLRIVRTLQNTFENVTLLLAETSIPLLFFLASIADVR